MGEIDRATVVVVVANIAQALSHPTRLRILELLRGEGAYVMDLTEWTGRPQANISQHLAILRDAGLVVAEREGMAVRYRIKDDRVFEIMDKMKVLAEAQIVSGAVSRMEQSPKFQRMMQKCKGGKMPRGRKTWKKW